MRPEERICNFCNNNEVEDEIHFLVKCDYYLHERNELFERFTGKHKNFQSLSDEEKFMCIISSCDKDLVRVTGHFVTACFKKRCGSSS